MKILLFSTKDFNDGEYMRKYVKELKEAGYDITQESYSPGGSTPYPAYYIELDKIEDIFKIGLIVKHSMIVNTSIDDDSPFIEFYDTYREPYSPKE
jgi:hypothetical protein